MCFCRPAAHIGTRRASSPIQLPLLLTNFRWVYMLPEYWCCSGCGGTGRAVTRGPNLAEQAKREGGTGTSITCF